jgi:hypothetical protein
MRTTKKSMKKSYHHVSYNSQEIEQTLSIYKEQPTNLSARTTMAQDEQGTYSLYFPTQREGGG